MSHFAAIAQHAFCVEDTLQHLYDCIWQPGQAILGSDQVRSGWTAQFDMQPEVSCLVGLA